MAETELAGGIHRSDHGLVLGLAIGTDRQRQLGVTAGLFLQGVHQAVEVVLFEQLVVHRKHPVGADGDVQLLDFLVFGRRTAHGFRQVNAQLGLLGTVLGMIDIFSSFMGSGMTTNAAVLAGGISKALITTAAGLMVGIPSVFFHRFLQRRIDELVVGMEQEAIKLVEVVQGDRDVDLVGGKA